MPLLLYKIAVGCCKKGIRALNNNCPQEQPSHNSIINFLHGTYLMVLQSAKHTGGLTSCKFYKQTRRYVIYTNCQKNDQYKVLGALNHKSLIFTNKELFLSVC